MAPRTDSFLVTDVAGMEKYPGLDMSSAPANGVKENTASLNGLVVNIPVLVKTQRCLAHPHHLSRAHLPPCSNSYHFLLLLLLRDTREKFLL